MSKERTNKEKLFDIIKKPLITEKSMMATTIGQYTFEVSMDATKVEIAQAIEQAFPGRKVKKVRTVYMPSHAKRMGYKMGRTDSSKKAIVTIDTNPTDATYLAKGGKEVKTSKKFKDSIEEFGA